MVCPFCLHKKTQVYNSRRGARLNVTWRRRQCSACGGQFTTYESADPGSILMLRDKESLQPFSHTNLLLSLLRACDHRNDLDESAPYLCSTIEQKLFKLQFSVKEKTVTKNDIVASTANLLKNYYPVAYVVMLLAVFNGMPSHIAPFIYFQF